MFRILNLFKLQIDNKYDILKVHNFKLILKNIFKFALVFILIFIGANLLLSKMFLLLGLTNSVKSELLAIVILFIMLVLLVFDIGHIISNMYLSNENELLFVLPVSFNDIFISKILFLYFNDVLFGISYLLPVIYAIGYIGSLGTSFYLLSLLMLFILPIFTLALGALLSLPAMGVVKYLNKHQTFSIILTLSLVVLAFVLYMGFISTISGAFNIADDQIGSSIEINNKIKTFGSKIFYIYSLAQFMHHGGEVSAFFFFILISLILFGICFLIIRPYFIKISTITTEKSTKLSKKKGTFKIRKPFMNIFINEMRLVFRSPSYIFQYFIFPLLMPLIVFTYDKLLFSIAVNQYGKIMIIASHFLVLGLISLMSNVISASSISREGANFYISKVTPLSYYTQIAAKVLFNFVITASAILITTILTLILIDIDPFITVFGTMSILLLNFGHICYSLDLDLSNPILKWYDNSEISAISKSTFKSIVSALVLSFISCLLIVILSTLSVWLAFGIFFILALLLALGRCHNLYIKTKYCYERIEV